MQYSNMLKNKMIKKMTGPYATSATALSKQVNVSQSTLFKWLHSAGVDPRIIRAIIIRLNCKSLECSDEKIKKQKNDQTSLRPYHGSEMTTFMIQNNW